MELSQSQENQEIKQDKLKTQIVSAITDLEGDRDLVDFSKENRTIDLMSPAQAKSPTPKSTFTPTKQVDGCYNFNLRKPMSFLITLLLLNHRWPEPRWPPLTRCCPRVSTPGTEANVLTAWLPPCNGTGLALTQSIDFVKDHVVAFAWKVAFPNLTWNFACVAIPIWWHNHLLRIPSPRPSRICSPRRPWSRSSSSPSPSPSSRCPTVRHTLSPWPWPRHPGMVYRMDSMSSCQQR